MPVWLSNLFTSISAPLTEVVKGWNTRRTVKAQGKVKIAQAKIEARVARYTAEARRAERQAEQDYDYDMEVLRNRSQSVTDDIIIVYFLALFGFHFIPDMQPYMASGWQALGYAGAPWWFEFAIVGILVSTLGLMRLFRHWKQLRERHTKRSARA